jgi:hypothetical protein
VKIPVVQHNKQQSPLPSSRLHRSFPEKKSILARLILGTDQINVKVKITFISLSACQWQKQALKADV